jgi:hypothetical protein
LILFALLSLLGGLLVAAKAPPAYATSPPTSCPAFKHNVEGSNSAQDGNHIGIKTSLWYGHPSSDCIRVSSMGEVNGDGSVEFGWFLGWDKSAGNLYTGPGACQNNVYYGRYPELFLVWEPIGGGYHCQNIVAIGTDQYLSTWIHDTNMNTVWDADTSVGGQVASANVNFSRGTAVTNGERHNNNDSAYSDFKSLQFQLAGNGSTWYDFNSSYKYADDDPDYHWVKDSDTHTEVNHD